MVPSYLPLSASGHGKHSLNLIGVAQYIILLLHNIISWHGILVLTTRLYSYKNICHVDREDCLPSRLPFIIYLFHSLDAIIPEHYLEESTLIIHQSSELTPILLPFKVSHLSLVCRATWLQGRIHTKIDCQSVVKYTHTHVHARRVSFSFRLPNISTTFWSVQV